MVLSTSVVGATFGYWLMGWVGAILGLFIAGGLMNKFVIRRRYFR
jgi:hypothetical protein